MKNLKLLKEEILDGDIKNFYVFYGPDMGIRKHYIDKIRQSCSKLLNINSYQDYNKAETGGGLFKTRDLYLIFNDVEFASRHKTFIETFINRIKKDVLIFDFDEIPKKNLSLFEYFEDYITYFPIVKDNIAYQFIDSEVTLSANSRKQLAWDCENNYSNILLETDKIKNYAQVHNITDELAYNELQIQNQLIYKDEEFHSYQFMNDVLDGNYSNYSYWIGLIQRTFLEDFWITLESISNDYMIAYYIKAFGKSLGSNKAYENKFYWNRIKTIRDLKLPYKANDLLKKAEQVCQLDALVKFGKISKEKVLDYFLCIIL